MDVKQLCKRFICGLAAVSLMLFAVFVTPFRGSALDVDTMINAAIDYCYDAGTKILDKFALIPGMSIPVNYAAKPVLDMGYQFFKGDGYADQAKQKWFDFTNQGTFNEVDVSTSQCVSGLYSRNGKVHTISCFLRSNATYDINQYVPLISCEDYQIMVQFFPVDNHGAEDYFIYVQQGLFTLNNGNIQYFLRFTDRNHCKMRYQITVFSNGDTFSHYSSVDWYDFAFTFTFVSGSVPIALPDSMSDLNAYFTSASEFLTVDVGTLVGSVENVRDFPESHNYNSFTSENIYNYYQNDVYPSIVNEYPEITFNSPQYYYEINNPTEPTETGEAAPFTLPPEWLEDRVELETDHYTVPYTDLVQDPWEYIQGQATTTSTTSTTELLRAGSPGEDTWTETLPGVLHADPAIMTSLWDFENFAQELLSRSGLWAIFAGLTAAGICIRLISLH